MASSSYSYAVFRYVKDARQDWTVPVGVALWSNDTHQAWTRFVTEHEKISRISKADDLPYIEFTARKLRGWIASGELPLTVESLPPGSDQWWRHVSKLLIHNVRLSEPMSVDCHDPQSEIDPLFTSLVKAEHSEELGERIDSMLRKALGDALTDVFHRGSISGFAGKPVSAMRVLNGTTGDVIVDAVNLSSSDAPRQADEVVGKLQRARHNGDGFSPKHRPVWAIVGYLSSPGGLNGEGYLKDWIEKAGRAKAFDLLRENELLRNAAREAMQQADADALPS